MQKYITKTPDGTRDLLFEECEIHSRVKGKLSALFMSRGYYEVVTPSLEYYDLFSLAGAEFSQTEMAKLTEPGAHRPAGVDEAQGSAPAHPPALRPEGLPGGTRPQGAEQ